jgi:anti-sigma B factor antagonist
MTIQVLETNLRKIQGFTIIGLNGEINGFAGTAMQEVFDQAETTNGSPIILDFTCVNYINSTGIALIVNMLMRAQKSKRRLVACGLSEHYQEIFTLTRLADFIPMYPNLENALQMEKTQD